jgi:hypothetical protein
MNAAGTGPFVMHALDTVDVHIWAPSPDAAYQEQVTDETSGQTSSVLVLNSPGDGPLTPEFDTQQIGNALDWGAVWDTPMSFVYEIGHSDIYGDHPGQADTGGVRLAVMLGSRKRCGPVGAGGQVGAEWRDQRVLCSQRPCAVRKCARRRVLRGSLRARLITAQGAASPLSAAY